eukprot:SAG25_NODE_2083_length_1974_cov_2.658667_3_plen_177_part_00
MTRAAAKCFFQFVWDLWTARAGGDSGVRSTRTPDYSETPDYWDRSLRSPDYSDLSLRGYCSVLARSSTRYNSNPTVYRPEFNLNQPVRTQESTRRWRWRWDRRRCRQPASGCVICQMRRSPPHSARPTLAWPWGARRRAWACSGGASTLTQPTSARGRRHCTRRSARWGPRGGANG